MEEIRNHESIIKGLKAGSFLTKPGDKLVIKHSSGVISNTITINLINEKTEENFYFGLPNEIGAWKFLKNINEMGARTVKYQIDENPEFPYEDSLPYKSRFDKNYKRR